MASRASKARNAARKTAKTAAAAAANRSKARNRGRSSSSRNSQGGRDFSVDLNENLNFSDNLSASRNRRGGGSSTVFDSATQSVITRRSLPQNTRTSKAVQNTLNQAAQQNIRRNTPLPRLTGSLASIFGSNNLLEEERKKREEDLIQNSGNLNNFSKTLTDSLKNIPKQQTQIKKVTSGSSFVIRGGKAIPRDAIGDISPIVQDTSLLTKKNQGNFVISAPQKTGDASIDAVFAGQQATTKAIAENFVRNRQIALDSGATAEEAAEIAQQSTKGLTKQEANAINTALQKDIIESKAGQIQLAEQLIKTQTTGGNSGDLDNLQQVLKTAPPIQVTKIPVVLDSSGNDINPRRTKLTIENAILTGQTLEDLELDVTIDKNAAEFDRGGFVKVIDGELQIDDLTTVFPKGVIDLQGLQAGEIFNQITANDEVLTQQITDLTIGNEEALNLLKQTPTNLGEDFKTSEKTNVFESINPTDLITSETDEGLVVFTTKSGEEVFRGTPQQAADFLNQLFEAQQGVTQEQQTQFANLIQDLRARIEAGEALANILEQLLALIGAANAAGKRQTSQEGTDNGTSIQTGGVFDGVLAFFSGIIAAIVAFFSNLTGGAQ